MTSNGLYGGIFALVLLQICTVYGQDDIIKGSLAFVIDDTASMYNEIRQVKEEVNIIFEKVLSSKASQIENFVLVTFNDPTAELRTITKKREEFKSALAAIHVHGGDDCPEYAMTGIELALKKSLPLSYLYVFTDASAKDYANFERIKSISQKKQIQVVFILTGECGSESSADFQVYHKVAEATSGQVFHMMKDDVKDILKYIEESITSRGVTLLDTKLPPGYGKTLKYPVDSHTGEVLIAVTGKRPVIGTVTGPDGSKPTVEPIVSGKREMAVVKVPGAKPGEHTVELGSSSVTHAVITAKSSINFQLGFSVVKPATMKNTVTRPPPEGDAFIGVRLLGVGVKLTTVKIMDLSGKEIADLPLELVDEKAQFYRTKSSFYPPTTMFRYSVSGTDEKGELLTRAGPTPMARQDRSIATDDTTNKSPEITIVDEPKIIVEYDTPAQLLCQVHGYPAPEIVWEEKDSVMPLPAKMKTIDLPYDYASILDIEKVNKNVTYQCKATNSVGTNIKYIRVEAKRKIYFNVVETPKDIRVGYSKAATIVCKIDSYPPPTITWYKDGKAFTGNSYTEISSDIMVITINNMQPALSGMYMCEASNDFNRKLFTSQVTIFGVEKPIVDKTNAEIRVREKRNAELSCRILKGIPKPTISWYFQPLHKTKFRLMKETSDTVQLNYINQDQAGSYKCIAKNELDSDVFVMELIVEYPPQIKDDVTAITSKDDDEVKMSCDVTGEPTPAVSWFFNGKKLNNDARTRISSDNSLKFKARIPDAGEYTCEAQNKHGTEQKTVFLDIFVPVTIQIPKETTKEIMVGRSNILYCRADGYPKPTVRWTFYSFDSKIIKDVTPRSGPSVFLRNVQLRQQGYYTCVASNSIGGSANITYEVKVLASPVIENIYPSKVFEAVEGDLALRIKCRASGSPTPTITWMREGLKLAMGSEWYDMEPDGTLVIKKIDAGAQGTYVCVAQNSLGNATDMYEVIVTDSSTSDKPTSTVSVVEGKSIDIQCDIPHKITDQVRWFKNGLAIATGDLRLYDVTPSDDGLYTCRVSDFIRSRSATTKVIVGFKPRFSTKEDDTIEFVRGSDAEILSCEAYGQPNPKSAIWKHNGKVLSTTSMSYPLAMKLGATGTYECEVSNEFGSIHRSFKVTSRDCILDLKKDFPERQPIMFSPSLEWPDFSAKEGYMIIPHRDYFFFNCPSQFTLPFSSNIMAFCERDNKIKINGKIYKFSDIQCKKEVPTQISKTRIECLPGNTEYVQIGYKVHSEFLKAYEVCVDKDNNVPLFAKQKLSPRFTNTTAKAEWSSSKSLDFKSLYDCRRQVYDISMYLGRGLRSDSCCFGRRQLVDSHNLQPGVPTSASFNYLNAVPQWSSCNSKNWDDVEERVRNLVKGAGRSLTVFTGVANPKAGSGLTLNDGRGGKLPAAEYLWKVVQDPPMEASLAIIQVNIPELSSAVASNYELCPNMCEHGSIEWMKNSNWKNVEDGYTYCCEIEEFEKAFGYEGQFSPYMNYILFSAPLIPFGSGSSKK